MNDDKCEFPNCKNISLRNTKLCEEHLKNYYNHEIDKCEICNKWHILIEPCECKYTSLPKTGFNECIECGQKTNGYAFCKVCYNKYNDEYLLQLLNEHDKNSKHIIKPINEDLFIDMEIYSKLLGKCKIKNLWEFRKNKYCSLVPLDNITASPWQYKLKDMINDLYYYECNDKNEENLLSNQINNENETDEEEIEELDNNTIIIDKEDDIPKCLICGNKTNGLILCEDCQIKYKNKDIMFKTSNHFRNIEKLSESYEGYVPCDDGHIVKSRSEQKIDDYLFNKNIKHIYEAKKLYYGEKSNQSISPDFYLPNYLDDGTDVIIEHWGDFKTKKYLNIKKFKLEFYEKEKLTVICTHEKTEKNKINETLERKLNKKYIKKNEINFLDEND